MYKVVWVARFKEGLAPEEARRHWAGTHGPLGAQVSQIGRYVQNHVRRALGPVGVSPAPSAFDGYSCCWYADRAAFESSLATDAWRAVGADSPNLFDDSRWDGWSASLDARADPVRTRAAHAYWISMHGGHFGVQVPGINRYVQNHVVSAIGAAGETDAIATEYDGFSECWFDDEAAFEHAMASSEWLRMNEDADGLFDIEYSVPGMSAVLDEHVIVDGVLG